jgi:hypothetical protein
LIGGRATPGTPTPSSRHAPPDPAGAARHLGPSAPPARAGPAIEPRSIRSDCGSWPSRSRWTRNVVKAIWPKTLGYCWRIRLGRWSPTTTSFQGIPLYPYSGLPTADVNSPTVSISIWPPRGLLRNPWKSWGLAEGRLRRFLARGSGWVGPAPLFRLAIMRAKWLVFSGNLVVLSS